MENNEIKKNLIELIKKFDNRCTDCGKIFLGVAINGSTETGNYPIDVGLNSYSLSCGKCPDCAEKCYEGLHEYVRENGKVPCDDYTIYEFFEIKNRLQEFTDEEIDEFINESKFEIECCKYVDEDYQHDSLANGNPNIDGGVLVDLFKFFKDELQKVLSDKEDKE